MPSTVCISTPQKLPAMLLLTGIMSKAPVVLIQDRTITTLLVLAILTMMPLMAERRGLVAAFALSAAAVGATTTTAVLSRAGSATTRSSRAATLVFVSVVEFCFAWIFRYPSLFYLLLPSEARIGAKIGVFVRSDAELPRARAALTEAGLKAVELDGSADMTSDAASLCTMHLAKGFEFRAVVVAACDDEVVPLQTRIEAVPDESDLEEVYNTERHLLYVACTRARDNLLITGVDPASEFIDDLCNTIL